MADAQRPGVAHWFGVRTIYEVLSGEPRLYEERVTVWQAQSLDEAIDLAIAEAYEYVEEAPGTIRYLGIAQGYSTFLPDGPLASGGEVFSLMRSSELGADAYIDRFFSTGTERESTADE